MARVSSLTIKILHGMVCLPFCVLLLSNDVFSNTRDLTTGEIRRTITGALIHMHTPIGTVVPVKYAADGTLSGEAGAVAFFLGSATDRGKWWVKDRQLCQKWNVWFRGKARCIRVKRVGRKFYWRDGKGESGTATIVAQPRPKAKTQIARKPVKRAPPKQRVAKLSKPKPVRPSKGAFSGHRSVVPKGAASAPIIVPKPRIVTRRAPKPEVRRPEAPGANRLAQVSPEPFRKTHKRRFRVVGVRRDDVLNMRVRPNSDAAVVSSIPAQASGVDLIGPCVGEWCRVRFSDRLGWVHSAYMELENPPAANRSSGELNGFRVVGVQPDDRLNIRIAPSSESKIVATIPPFGRGIRIIGACAEVWCPIAYRQANGWVNSLFIEREDTQASTRVR